MDLQLCPRLTNHFFIFLQNINKIKPLEITAKNIKSFICISTCLHMQFAGFKLDVYDHLYWFSSDWENRPICTEPWYPKKVSILTEFHFWAFQIRSFQRHYKTFYGHSQELQIAVESGTPSSTDFQVFYWLNGIFIWLIR